MAEHSNKVALQANFDSLKLQNALLEGQLVKDNQALTKRIESSTDTLANLSADKALQASEQLTRSTKELEILIFGGSEFLPILAYKSNQKTLSAIMINHTKFPNTMSP